ncbi:Histone transcription regulator 3 [Coemansia spiralis]|nr:Histone transcription regulator 3 [Coemansia spiralis]
MRGAGKQLASFYKTDFEAAGKHYLYLEKYLLLYIDTLTATLDIGGIRALARKLQRTADMLYDAPAMLRRVGAAEMAILQGMVRGLNCPRLAGSGTGEEQIVLQLGNGSAEAQTRAVFRHSRLNRTQFNYARDFARENIVRITAVRQHIRAALACAEATAPTAEVPTLDTATMRDALTSADRDITGHLETADKAVALFGHLLDQKKHADDPEALSQLNDNVADVYALVLSTYGQSRCAAHTPLPHEATPADICRHASELLAQAPRPASPSGPFWRCITFDEARHDGSQQYKLLDPLLEFQVNKLLDSVHAAQARTGSSPAQDSQAPPAAASPEDPSLAAAGDGIPAQVL